MLNLIFAPSADTLVPLAADRIRSAWADPFDPPAIIVPNPAVGKWLSVKLAELPAFGCIANANMPTLEKFLWEALGGAGTGAKLLNAEHITQIVCALLDDALLENREYQPLKNYLCGESGRDIDALKRVQLSAKIAQLFLEYEYNRPSVWDEKRAAWKVHAACGADYGIDAQWLRGGSYFGKLWPADKKYDDGRRHEEWQMDLYRRVNRCLEPADYITLPHLYRQKRERSAKSEQLWCDVGTNKQVFLFGVSKISHFHRNTLVEISQISGVDMHVFLTNPCAEFWEDVNTSRRWRWNDREAGITPVREDEYGKEELERFPDEQEDHALLKQWGGAGKENIFLWCPLAEWNFEYHGDNADGGTLLASIQKSLLSRVNKLEYDRDNAANDRSLQILACPDAGREVEELREMILDLTQEKVIGDFSEVAVYMPDPNNYLPHIQRVFGAYAPYDPNYIPFSVLCASGGSSLAARGFSALLGIVSGEFNRARIFELLRNPIVRASKRIRPAAVDVWERMAEEFGIFRGYDSYQRKSMGDMGGAVTDEHTFKRGIEACLETINICGAIAGDKTLSDIFPRDTGTQKAKEYANDFLALIEELNGLSKAFIAGDDFDGRNLSAAKTAPLLSIEKSVDTFRSAVCSWLGTIPEDGAIDSIAEARVRRAALDGLETIKLQRRAGISREEFTALARACVPSELTAPAAAWSGVTFAPLRASMVLPHRAIFALGLDAAAFPGSNDKGDWDLLARKRIIGDSDRVRDNRFAFLELLHAARKRLALSFRARDMQKDEDLQPSSVVLELEDYLMSRGITVDGEENSRRCAVRREIPWVVHESLEKAAAYGRKHGTWDKALRELAKTGGEIEAAERKEGVKIRKGHRHDLTEAAADKNELLPNSARQYETTIYDLKMFMDNPLEYHLYRTLSIRDNGDDSNMSAVDEPLDSGSLHTSDIRKKVWTAVLKLMFTDKAGAEAVQEGALKAANEIYDTHIGSGHAPEGYFCNMERKSLLAWTTRCAHDALTLRGLFPNHRLEEKMGFSSDFADGEFKAALKVELPLTLVPENPGDKSQSQRTGILAFGKNSEPEYSLELWLEGLALWRREIRGQNPAPVTLAMLERGDIPEEDAPMVMTCELEMEKGGEQDARIEYWMAGILKQMLEMNRCDHLPFRAIKNIINPEKNGFDDGLASLTLKDVKGELSGFYGYKTYTSGFDLTDARPEETDDDKLRGLIRERYAPILGKWIIKGKNGEANG
ncbi:MAG: exodeoxyribonuclease V subunit gamma [Chitinispirillia bacterium]|nr:exodeoxyribonuclease V subunit gamma [Chitinispirillia bacterium]